MNRYRGTMSQFLAWRRSLSGWLLSGIACLTLAGCSAGFSPHTAEGTAAPGQAQHQVADFVAVDCADIWAHSSDASDKNPLYWLRGIDCADRLAPAQARAEAKRHTDDSWQDAFRRGILLADAKITPEERRDLVETVQALCRDVENIVGAKDSSGDIENLKAYIRLTRELDKEVAILAGNDGAILTCLKEGGAGGIAGRANIWPETVAKIYDCFKAGDLEGTSIYGIVHCRSPRLQG